MRIKRQAACAAALTVASPAAAAIAEPIAVDGGQVSGATEQDPSIRIFKGIPFAAPPVGSLRWQPPQPVQHWDAALKADRFAPDCPQIYDRPVRPTGKERAKEQSEDCLYLNVWTGAQNSGEKRPVMVWIYGGGYRAGSAAYPAYDGTALARKGVVYVSIAYRVGALGFMAHEALSAESPRHVSGNYGLLDQIAALQWVRRNIASFGGDPDRITIFGQSAGSMSTSYLAASPLATGTFHRLIGQTGAGFGMLTPVAMKEAEQKGTEFGRSFNARTAEELRAISADQLVKVAGLTSGTFQPVNDGWAVPGTLAEIYQSGQQNDVAMMVGSNADERGEDPRVTRASFLSSLKNRYAADADALTHMFPARNDAQARASSRRLENISLGDLTMYSWASAQAATGKAPVYIYRFSQNPPIPPKEWPGGPNAASPGAWHGAEIVYAMANLWAHNWPWTDRDRQLSEELASYWVNFAKTGNPNGSNLPHWPSLQDDAGKVMELGDKVRPIDRPNQSEMKILSTYYNALIP